MIRETSRALSSQRTETGELDVTERKVAVFLYGLFMDMDVLQQRGFAPSHPQVASLDGYDIVIGDRATLVPHAAALLKAKPRLKGCALCCTKVNASSFCVSPWSG